MARSVSSFLVGLTALLFAATAHAGHNGVQVHSLSSDAEVLVRKVTGKRGYETRLLKRPYVDATLHCKVSGFRVAKLGGRRYSAKTTRERYRWLMDDKDIARYRKKLVKACKKGQSQIEISYLPPHSCKRVKGVASKTTVHQSARLKIKLQCTTVNNRWYELPENCEPLSPPRPTKTGHLIPVGCLKEPTFKSQPGLTFKYVDSFFVSLHPYTRRVALPDGCELSGKGRFITKTLPSGERETEGVQVPLKCNHTRRLRPESRTFGDKTVFFVRAVQLDRRDERFGIPPVIPLPVGCEQRGSLHAVKGGYWMNVKCKVSKPLPTASFVDRGKNNTVYFTEKDEYIKYCAYNHQPPAPRVKIPEGPLLKMPAGCFQYVCGEAFRQGAGKPKTLHRISVVCNPGVKMMPKKIMGESELHFNVVNVPKDCWTTQAHAISVGMKCKKLSDCNHFNVGNVNVICEDKM